MPRKRSRTRRQTRRKKLQKGGNGNSSELAFYTGYFGPNDVSKGFTVPPLPSDIYDCYYFTNNPSIFEQLKATKWKPVFVNIPIKNNYQLDALDAKEMKAAPHHFKELQGYTFICYYDSKLNVYDRDIVPLLDALKASKAVIAVGAHPNLKSIQEEFEEAMKHDRYRIEKDKLLQCIQKYGSKETPGYKHHCTGFILRKQGPLTTSINEEWYRLIQECGTECQITFGFIYMKYSEFILTSNACAKFTGNHSTPIRIDGT